MRKDYLILFDGVCNFCNYWVRFALKRDQKQKLSFGTLQGNTTQSVLPLHGINEKEIASVVFIENGKLWQNSSAVLRICRHLSGAWKLFYALMIIPAPIRDFIYKMIAKNRYRWFGKRESCMVPDASMKDRFVD
ncbi:MAG: thiol-disulfide oxidoreductase DCC family protein [Bacteroidetes bacterium]|nr:thiol-disulfide oxidoreductase DCC family protein [Bacteroidota bacterium]